MSSELNEYGVPDNPPSEVKDNVWCLDFVKMNLTELREGKGQLTTEQLVELYKNAPREDGHLDKYRVKLIGKWSNRRLKVKWFFQRLFKVFMVSKNSR